MDSFTIYGLYRYICFQLWRFYVHLSSYNMGPPKCKIYFILLLLFYSFYWTEIDPFLVIIIIKIKNTYDL